MHNTLHRAAKAFCYGVFVLVCEVVLELAELGCCDAPRAANSLSVWGPSVVVWGPSIWGPSAA